MAPLALVGVSLVIFAGVAWGMLDFAVGRGDPATALLLPLTAIGVALLAFVPALSMTYLCVIMPLLITLNRHAGPWGAGRIAVYVLVSLSSLVAALTWLHSRPPRTRLAPAALLLLIFVIYLAGHVAGAEDSDKAFEALLNYTYVWPFLLLPIVLLRERWQLRIVLLSVAGLGAFLALASIAISFLVASPSDIFLHQGRFDRVHLYFGTANSLGMFLSIALFVLLYGVQAETRWHRLLKTGAQLAILFAILLTFSRRTWLATGVLLFIHYVRHRDWRAMALILVVAGLLSARLVQDLGERAESMVDMEHQTNLDRKREFSENLHFLFGDGVSWSGWGLEKAASASGHRGPGRLYFHNFYLTLYYLAGVAGLLIYLTLNLLLFRGLNFVRRRARAPDAKGAAAAGMAVTGVVLITGLFGMGNVTFPMNYFAALVPGLGFAAVAIEHREARRRPPEEPVEETADA